MTKTTIKSLTAENYRGQFESEIGQLKIEGSFSANNEKKINNLSGAVTQGKNRVAGFNAYRQGDKFSYNFSEVNDLDSLAQMSAAVKEAIEELPELVANYKDE